VAGNEFYEPYAMLSGSGDPAAACCSTITELGNPEINHLRICGQNTRWYSGGRGGGEGGGDSGSATPLAVRGIAAHDDRSGVSADAAASAAPGLEPEPEAQVTPALELRGKGAAAATPAPVSQTAILLRRRARP
jgi:hypothetical protein